MEIWMAWLTAGVAMILLEFLIPGVVIVFFGIAAVAMGVAFYLGLLSSLLVAFALWVILSLALMLVFRSIFSRYLGGDFQVQNVDEDIDIKGSLVRVIEGIEAGKPGRVRFRDSTWEARAEEPLAAGQQAVIVGREGKCLLVGPLKESTDKQQQ